jgi:DNA mismatch repair ATPase MutL
MDSLPLETTGDLVRRLAREGDPIRAVVELIWNALDAEATRVVVDVKRSALEAITRVTVLENGLGIRMEQVRNE